MLKEIRALLKDGSSMYEVIQRLVQMTTDAEYVYTRGWEVCIGQAVIDRTEPEVRNHDKEINRNERAVRRLIVEHLSINPGQDVSGCLAVLLMAKDVERVGDHSRNIFTVGAETSGGIADFKCFPKLEALHNRIGELFPLLRDAIQESNEKTANDILELYQRIKPDIKALSAGLYEQDAPAREAVAATLLTRYHMRINAHIGNAASGVIFPLENIDFVSRGMRQAEKDR